MISLIILLVCLLMLLPFSFFKMSLVKKKTKKKTCDAFDSVMNGNADELNKHLHVYI